MRNFFYCYLFSFVFLNPIFSFPEPNFSPAPQLSKLQSMVPELDSLTAQVQQLFLESDIKYKEAMSRLAESPFVCQGRLTVVSGTPVPTTDQSNMTTIYFTPYHGSRIGLYTGTVWNIHAYTERSLALAALTGDTNYDVFIYNNAGTLTLELTAWASNTARATAIVLQDGVYVRSGATTRRYLGTIRVTSATQTQDTKTQRFVWNYYNRVQRPLQVLETTDSWAYTTAAWRQVNAAAANKIEFVHGYNENPVFMRALEVVTADGTNRTNVSTSFGLDSTANSFTLMSRGGSARNTLRQQMWAQSIDSDHGLGYHQLYWLEWGNGTAFTVYGDDAGDGRVQSGMQGWIEG